MKLIEPKIEPSELAKAAVRQGIAQLKQSVANLDRLRKEGIPARLPNAASTVSHEGAEAALVHATLGESNNLAIDKIVEMLS